MPVLKVCVGVVLALLQKVTRLGVVCQYWGGTGKCTENLYCTKIRSTGKVRVKDSNIYFQADSNLLFLYTNLPTNTHFPLHYTNSRLGTIKNYS